LLLNVILPDRIVDQVESALQFPDCRLTAVERSSGAGCEAWADNPPITMTSTLKNAARGGGSAGWYNLRVEDPLTGAAPDRWGDGDIVASECDQRQKRCRPAESGDCKRTIRRG
jgi:hypothetical protein